MEVVPIATDALNAMLLYSSVQKCKTSKSHINNVENFSLRNISLSQKITLRENQKKVNLCILLDFQTIKHGYV